MAVYKRGDHWYVDFTFKGQRVRESIGPSRKDAENPAKKVKFLKGVTSRLRYLMPHEVGLLISNFEGFLNPLVTVAVHTVG